MENRSALIEQFLESIRRVQYVHVIRDKTHSPLRANPRSDLFDPLRAAAIHGGAGDIEEACWLVFLATHFGKHRKSGWRLTRDVYGALGQRRIWSWDRISNGPDGISGWLRINYDELTSDGIQRHFG